MSTININRIVLTGNLVTDPDLRATPSGTPVCNLRIASSTRRKDNATGDWVDKPNYFDIIVWGTQGATAAKHLAKGRPVAIDGRLEWREWEAQDGTKRQALDVVADTVQFLGSPTAVHDEQHFELQLQDAAAPRPRRRSVSQPRYTRPQTPVAA